MVVLSDVLPIYQYTFQKYEFLLSWENISKKCKFSYFVEYMMGRSLSCDIPSFVKICPLGQEKIVQGFYPIWVLQSPWLCDQHPINIFSFPCT